VSLKENNMPKACVDRLLRKNKNMSKSQAHKICYPGQKAGTSSKEEQSKVGWDIAKSKNVRTKAKLKKEAKKRLKKRSSSY